MYGNFTEYFSDIRDNNIYSYYIENINSEEDQFINKLQSNVYKEIIDDESLNSVDVIDSWNSLDKNNKNFVVTSYKPLICPNELINVNLLNRKNYNSHQKDDNQCITRNISDHPKQVFLEKPINKCTKNISRINNVVTHDEKVNKYCNPMIQNNDQEEISVEEEMIVPWKSLYQYKHKFVS